MAEMTTNEEGVARENEVENREAEESETESMEVTTDDVSDEVMILNEEAPNVDYEDGEPDRIFKNPSKYKYTESDTIEKGCFVDLHCWTETGDEVSCSFY